MFLAEQFKQKSLFEYLLYMWQVEDLLRSYQLDVERISKEYVSKFELSAKDKKKSEQWYADLCDMMRSEGKKEKGHLQICQNALQSLTELHAQLLASPNFPYYKEMYYKVLPYIVELRAKEVARSKSKDTASAANTPEIETCLNLVYGFLVLKMKGEAISEGTMQAVKDVSAFLDQLSQYYAKNQIEPLQLD